VPADRHVRPQAVSVVRLVTEFVRKHVPEHRFFDAAWLMDLRRNADASESTLAER